MESFYKFYVNSISENISIGFILEVDLEYPDKLNVRLVNNANQVKPRYKKTKFCFTEKI